MKRRKTEGLGIAGWKSLVLGSLVIAWVPCVAAEPPKAVPVAESAGIEAPAGPDFSTVGRVVSRSQQFRVDGGDEEIRGSLALIAEEAKAELLELLQEADGWRQPVGSVPVSIRLHGQQGDPLPARTVATRLVATDAGYELIIDVHLSRGIDTEEIKKTVTQALIYERALRGKLPGGEETALSVPPWLVVGLREAENWNAGKSDRRLYEALFRHGGLFKMEQLFNVDEKQDLEMDAATRSAFRVSSGALVMALAEQPQGKEGFRNFLREVAAYEGEMPALLRRCFPGLNLSETSIAKWWALQMAEMGTAPLTDSFSISDTERQLDEILVLSLQDEHGSPVRKPLSGSWEELKGYKIPERAQAVRAAQDELVRLSYRCFPSYRPMIAEYQLILNALVTGKTAKMDERLAALEETRVGMVVQANRGRDFLDWFEITRARQTSGAFDDYLTLKRRLQARKIQRHDALTKYLDRMDALFNRGQQDSPRVPFRGMGGPSPDVLPSFELPPLPR
ncbi:MAG: hypothetical protein QM627_01150 [Luteolibacter sp.]